MKRKNYSNYAVVVIALLLATTVNAVPAEMEKKNLMEFVTKCVAKCKESAEAGDAEGQVLYGRALARGWGVEKDEAKAIEWYRKSAEQGNASGQCYLGMCFVNGIGCETDTTNGVKWLRKAALPYSWITAFHSAGAGQPHHPRTPCCLRLHWAEDAEPF